MCKYLDKLPTATVSAAIIETKQYGSELESEINIKTVTDSILIIKEFIYLILNFCKQ